MRRVLAIAVSLLLIAASAAGASDKGKPKSTITADDGTQMILVPEGTFLMGTNERDLPDTPIHKVFVSDFYLDEHQVTNAQYAAFLNSVNASNEKDGNRFNWIVTRDDIDLPERAEWWPTEIGYIDKHFIAYEGFENYPLLGVSWDGAKAYCEWAGKRLPTEAEWEKAARGGLELKLFPWGNELPTSSVSFNKVWRTNQMPPPTGPVKRHRSNSFGFYDMAGLVWEWCSDWYAPDYYAHSPEKDPRGPETGSEKVLRGGSWFNPPLVLRAGLRNSNDPSALDETFGFRCARNPLPGDME